MLTARTIAVVAGVALTAVGVLAIYLFLELGSSNGLLADTRKTLTDTQATLSTTQGTLRETDAALTAQRAANVDLAQKNTTVIEYNATLTANLGNALGAIDEWQVAFAGKEADLAATSAELRETSSELSATESRLISVQGLYDETRATLVTTRARMGVLRNDYDAATAALAETNATLAALQSDFTTLQSSAGDVQRLEERAAALEAEIAELEARRKPLILRDSRGGFTCTGSMTPAITCMDEATWLDNFKPEDVVVGTTISFWAKGCWEDADADSWYSHRVVDIKIEDGVRYFWPKGDSNTGPDECWVAERYVDGYIIEIHKNARPDNAELHGLMFAAKAEYNEAHKAYYGLRDRYCTRGAQCTVETSVYNRLVALGDALDAAWDLYDCWTDVAVDSEYPGHIPRRC